jgi:biotin carboxyl carrier protein
MQIRRFLKVFGGTAVLVLLGAALFLTRERWMDRLTSRAAEEEPAEDPGHDQDHEHDHEHEHESPGREAKTLKLSAQARRNLGLVSKPAKPQTYWRTIQLPGVIEDRPGISDRGVVAPAISVVTKVHVFPGDTLRPGDRLFTLRLISEYLQNTQTELLKATRDAEIVKEQYDRLEGAVKKGALAETRLIDLNNQSRRLAASIQAYRQDLLTRGLTPLQIDEVASGRFVSEIEIVAPPARTDTVADARIQPVAYLTEDDAKAPTLPKSETPIYEVQDLKVELGQQVQVGQMLCLLSSHQLLYIKGNAFKRESPFLEEAAQHGWPINVEFAEDDGTHWPVMNQTFRIRHLANSVDAASRTFAFFIPLSNQSRAYEKSGHTFLVWRFRPGQRVRLHVPVEEMKDVFVLPAGAVVREGPEAYVFRQNGDLFDRRPVEVLHEDRLHAVIANDGSIAPGFYLAQSAAASLNRVMKAQNSSGGLPPGFHVHADGTVHGAH